MEAINHPILVGNNKKVLDILNLTDAAPTRTYIVNTQYARDLMVAITSDKGCTVVVTPIDARHDDTALSLPSITGIVADGGASNRFLYESIVSPKAQIVITKTESGDMTSFHCSIRGQV